MYKVDIINSGNLDSIVGPVGTIKRILQNREFYLSNGFDITLCSKGKTIQNYERKESKKKKITFRHKIKEKLDTLAPRSYFLSKYLMEKTYMSFKKKVVDPYLKMNRNPDIVVFHSEIEAYWFMKSGLFRNVKTAVFFHSDGIPNKMWTMYYPKLIGSEYLELLNKRAEYVIKNADKVCCICNIGKLNMMSLYNVPENKIALIVNGVDDFTKEERIIFDNIRKQRKTDRIKLCCVGSVSIRKGQIIVLKALASLPKNIQDRYRLTIVGDGPALSYCKDFVSEHNMSEIVRFTGAIKNIDVYKEHADADAFILMSSNEGLPISILESLRAGLAIISTNVSGIPETVTNENGILINPEVEELRKVLSEPDRYDWNKMGENSRELFVNHFLFNRMRTDYLNMLKSLTKE